MRPDVTMESCGTLGVTQEQLDALVGAYDEISARLLPSTGVAMVDADDPTGAANVVGFGIGLKSTGGHRTEQPAVLVFVRKKVAAAKLAAATLVPDSVNGVAIDVEETGEITAYQFQTLQRPAPGGVSINNCKEVSAGTLGCWADDGKRPAILSNNHVMAMSNAGQPGDLIAQPGRLDGGACPNDAIATLTRWVNINFAAGGTNEVDAAIAAASNADYVDPRILRSTDNLEALVSPDVAATLSMNVQKSGRTTGWTKGTVSAIGVTVNVTYPGNRVARFDNQFRVTGTGGDFSQPGDSGSLVTTDPENQPTGLLFAGGGGSTFCNHIARVLTAINVTIRY